MNYQDMTISQLAAEIRKDWKPVHYTAEPYLQAMFSLQSISDNYFADSGISIVLYFLNNARSWKGEVAKAIKAELRSRAK